MSQQIDGNTRSFTADAAIALYARLKQDADGKVTTAGVSDKEIAVATREAFAADDLVTGKLNSAAGTFKMIANAALAVGDNWFTAASGKIGARIAGAYPGGVVLEASTADGDIIEVSREGFGEQVPVAVSVVATADGLTTGLIPAGSKFVALTVTTDADDIATLPAPVVGDRIVLQVGATGCELRTVAASNVKINDVDSDSLEAPLLADHHYVVECITATEWILLGFSKLGVDVVTVPN